ncbi:hypothetical protein ACJ72_03522 [Emergomyces africanus]|uniref:Ribophorin II C-terminal domain-containing protein n=1 Tax=Emergomyces africanus TaxID=1955775 RepID=A0A1B7NZS5_9EURO|nr:hypothetical protein ACJ72_03522 [Emergomyces africanus]
MQLQTLLRASLLFCTIPYSWAASGWGFDDATITIAQKDAGIGAGLKENSAKRPHQAFLLLKELDTGLDLSYPLSVKESGKARVELTQKDLPAQFMRSSKPIEASFVIASFGSAPGYDSPAFQLDVTRDDAVSGPLPSDSFRYGKREEIHHTFKPDPKSPPIIITLVFVGAVLAALPTLAGLWFFLGVNLNHLPVALKSSPIPHCLFLGSIVGLEVIFFLYYTTWNLFQTLPATVAVGAVAFVTGSRALSEVQGRRLAGLR